MFKISILLKSGARQNILRYSTKIRKKRQPFVEIEEQISEFITRGSSEPVDTLKSRLLANASNEFESNNFDAIFLRLCVSLNAADLGKRHFRLITGSDNEPGLAAVGKYFMLCGLDPPASTDEDRALVGSLYRRIMEKYDGLVDSSTCEAVTVGLSAVGRWHEAEQWLDKIQELGSHPSVKMLSSVAEGAFSDSHEEDGWRLLDRLGAVGKVPTDRLYEMLLSRRGSLEKVLFWHQRHEILFPAEAVDITRRASANDFNSTVTGVTYNGTCKSCQRHLPRLDLSKNEFDQLREAFLKPVLVGNDLFLKSRPEELQRFFTFLRSAGRVNVVLDGLNIAYGGKSKQNQNKAECAKMLQMVAKHFLSQGDRVMIIGREHMLHWSGKHLEFLKKECQMFFTENVSADDPFILYATMTNGLGTIFVSRDQMRGHKFLLKDPEMSRIFSKWCQIHQRQIRHVSHDGLVSLRSPVPYEIIVHRSKDGVWHLPVASEKVANVPPHLVPINLRWVCLTPKSSTKCEKIR